MDGQKRGISIRYYSKKLISVTLDLIYAEMSGHIAILKKIFVYFTNVLQLDAPASTRDVPIKVLSPLVVQLVVKAVTPLPIKIVLIIIVLY